MIKIEIWKNNDGTAGVVYMATRFEGGELDLFLRKEYEDVETAKQVMGQIVKDPTGAGLRILNQINSTSWVKAQVSA